MTGSWSPEERVRHLARDAGGGLAIVHDERRVSWAALDALLDGVAGDVAAAGVPRGGLVALDGMASVETAARVLGVLRAGAVAAPIPAGLTPPERTAALRVLQPVLVLGEHRPASAGRPSADPTPADPTPAGRTLDEPGVVVLTSGTTGRPKGVVLTLAALAASADAWTAALPPATGWLLALGLAHVAGLGVLWRAVAAGVPTRIVRGGDPVALLAGLEADPPPSHVSLVPAQLARLLDAAVGPPPATLRAVPLGGGPVPAGLVTRALEVGWPVVPTYGLSEAGSGVTALPTGEAAVAPGSAGRPLPGVVVSIEGPGPDGVGEIVVSSPAGFAGYLGEPPRAPGAPVRTGDLGRLDADGRLHVLDRRVDRIVRGGENVDPAEVEAVLLDHPAVADTAVVGRPDPLWGHVPVAAVVLRGADADPGDEALAAHARSRLAGFKVPAAFLRLDALPRTDGGKLRREAVRALVDGSPVGELARPGGDAVGWRVDGAGRLPVLLLHGTLSTALQLHRLAADLARPGDLAVHAIDRRGSGSSRLAVPRPLDVAVHVADLVAYLDARGIERAAVVGASFGGALGLELAAHHPGRVLAVVAWEPPYGPLADDATKARFGALADTVLAAYAAGGPPAAAETFLRAVGGREAWDRLPERSRRFLEDEGVSVLADATLVGLDPDGLGRIAAPVTVLTGGASEPFYAPIADSLAARIPGAIRDTLPGLAHPAPITSPAPVAAAVRSALVAAGLVGPSPEPSA